MRKCLGYGSLALFAAAWVFGISPMVTNYPSSNPMSVFNPIDTERLYADLGRPLSPMNTSAVFASREPADKP